MSEADFITLAAFHSLGDDPIPAVVVERGSGKQIDLVWRNELGGLTFKTGDEFVKWNPTGNGIDLERERARLEWLEGRHPTPRVIEFGSDSDAQWLVTAPVPGEHAVGDTWRARRAEAIRAMAAGLRAIHSIDTSDFPPAMADEVWVGLEPISLGPRPPIDGPVLVHGDACAPNTLISADGRWTGNVDFGDLGVGDRWADLAVASLSIDWNFGEGHQDELFEAYGIERDEERILYYRALWELES